MAKTDQSDRIRIGRSAKAIARDFLDNLEFLQGCTLEDAGRNDLYMALSYTVRDRMLASRARDIPAAAGSSLAEGSKTVSILTPSAFHDSNPLLKEIMALIRSGRFSPDTRDLFKPLVDRLMDRDEYMLFADFDAYIDCQAEIGRAYRDADRWTRMSILNTARMGKFSSDRAIREYCRDIWNIGLVRTGGQAIRFL